MQTEKSEADRERVRRKRAAKALGWKLAGQDMVEIKVERQFTLGPRVVVVRGRVPVEMPGEMALAMGLPIPEDD